MRGDALWAAVLEAYAAALVRRHAWLEARERERERERERGGEGGREGGRERVREGEREGGKEGGREGKRERERVFGQRQEHLLPICSLPLSLPPISEEQARP